MPKTGYGEGRFPQAPGSAWLKSELDPASAKTKNQPQGRDFFIGLLIGKYMAMM